MNAHARRQKKLHFVDVLGWLLKDQMIAPDAAQRAREQLSARGGKHKHPLVFIGQFRFKNLKNDPAVLDIESLTQWLAARVQLEYFHINPLKIDFTQVGEMMSAEYANRLKILPVSVTTNELVIATAEPFVTEWIADIERVTRRKVKLVLANPEDISRYLVEFFTLARSVKKASNSGKLVGVASFEHLVELGKKNKQGFDTNDQHIVSIVDWLCQYALEQRASDIHIEPRRDVGRVRFRIDGILHVVYQMPTPVMLAVLSRIKILGRMDVAEKRRPQDGRIKTKMPNGQEMEMRLSTLPTAFGEKMVMRIFDPAVLMRDLSAMGFNKKDQKRWEQMASASHGIVFVTGPTGSGKTTTLYSTLKQLSNDTVNVSTIEDPIEMIEPSFNQMQVQPQIALSFADGVRALMRQDPDIIMIGEVRDLQTAEMAIQAALTGHLVLATLHTNDAPSAVIRLLDLGVPSYLIQSTLIGVMAQRLVRVLCPQCKKAHAISAREQAIWQDLVAPWNLNAPAQIYRAEGCLDCRMTGYKGRVGLYEILLNSTEFSRHIQNGADVLKLASVAVNEGMHPLRIAGALKILEGVTDLDEVLRVVPGKDRV